jgi:hypothetical protein
MSDYLNPLSLSALARRSAGDDKFAFSTAFKSGVVERKNGRS